MIRLSGLNIEQIKSGKLANEFPEFYTLKNITEHNAGHINDPVFDHCVLTSEIMSRLISELPHKTAELLKEKIGHETKAELLPLTAFLHDIGKQLIIPNTDGAFIGHEKAGADLVRDVILTRTSISPEAQAHIVSIIAHHAVLHELSNNQHSIASAFKEFITQYPSFGLDLVLLVLADLEASDLDTLNPGVYNFKISFFKQALANWVL